MELISVHLPKTAGWSFRAALDAEYGDDLLPIYRDAEANGREWRAIHGHFKPRQFWSAGRNAALVMWMRDPVERIRSWYDFWQVTPPSGEPHHEAFRSSNMSLAEFAAWDITTEPFEHVFLDGTKGLESFDFIGITERYDDDLAKLAKLLGWKTSPETVRANTTPKEPTEIDPATRRAIERHHAFEIDFYHRAAERFA